MKFDLTEDMYNKIMGLVIDKIESLEKRIIRENKKGANLSSRAYAMPYIVIKENLRQQRKGQED